MADDVQAGTQSGAGPLFRAFSDGTRSWPASVMAFLTGGSTSAWTLQEVQDADAKRLPVKVGSGPTGTLTDRKGTITAGGTSQQLAAANAARKYLLIINPPTASEILYVNFTSAAAADNTSIPITPGNSLFMSTPNFVSTEVVTVFAATTGHTYAAKEG